MLKPDFNSQGHGTRALTCLRRLEAVDAAPQHTHAPPAHAPVALRQVRAVDGMYAERTQIFATFGIGLFCTILAAMFASVLIMQPETAFCAVGLKKCCVYPMSRLRRYGARLGSGSSERLHLFLRIWASRCASWPSARTAYTIRAGASTPSFASRKMR